MANILDISAFEKGKKYISLWKLSPDKVAFLIEKAPHLSEILNSDTDILFGKTESNIPNCIKTILFQIMNTLIVLNKSLLLLRNLII